MQKQILIASSILLGSSLISCIANAASSAPNAATATTAVPASAATVPPSDISKDTWLNAVVPMLPKLICKGFMNDPELKQRLDTIKMSYDQCVSAIPASVNKCKDQLYASIPAKINNEAASTWGKSLGECIGKDFATNFLLQKK